MTNRSIGYYVRQKGKTQWLYCWGLGTPDLLEVFLWIGWMNLDESSSEYVAFTEGTGFEKVTVERAEALHAGSTSPARRAAKAYGNAVAKTGGDGLAAFSLRLRQAIDDDPYAVVEGPDGTRRAIAEELARFTVDPDTATEPESTNGAPR